MKKNNKIDITELVRALELTTRLAWSLARDGTYERMEDVQPGDLVVENTTLGLDIPHAWARVGRLLRIEREPIYEVDANDNETEEIQGYETAYYVRTVSGEEFRWVDCQFIRVPDCWQALDVIRDGGDRQKTARRCPDCGAVWQGPSGVDSADWAYRVGWTQYDEQRRQCRNCKAGRPVSRADRHG